MKDKNKRILKGVIFGVFVFIILLIVWVKSYDNRFENAYNKMEAEINNLTNEADDQVRISTENGLNACVEFMAPDYNSFEAYNGCKKPFKDEIDEINEQLEKDITDVMSKYVDKWGIEILDNYK